ncbi:hypothetical protein HGRIS_009196 [Hohenbuehelia grisea]|uniref:short-chain 2-methylacyl-CoA dehydrogenase n=1 Tax=Hohenbuehelia grisea TaxID=104357 RepID=A0ABR3J0K0_9AGAR
MLRNIALQASKAARFVPRSTGVLHSARAFSASTAVLNEHASLPSLHTFTEEEQMLRDAVRKFATDVVGPKVREMDENEMMDPSVISGLFEQGLMGIETSADHNGAESSFTSAIIAIEELARIDPSVSVLCDVHNTLVNTVIRKYGTKEQQDKWLPQLAESKLGSFCLSESASGSDAFALQTRARKEGDSWILNGSKMWITNSWEAEVFLIFANVDPSKGYKGITCFVATKDMGIQIAKKEQKLGIRASSTCTLNFDDLKIPAENVIGGEGKGYKVCFFTSRLRIVLTYHVSHRWPLKSSTKVASVLPLKCSALPRARSTKLSPTRTNANNSANRSALSRVWRSKSRRLRSISKPHDY